MKLGGGLGGRGAGLLASLSVALAFAVAAAPAAAAKVATGAYISESWRDPALISRYGRQVGRPPRIVMTYKDWSSLPFSSEEFEAIGRLGAVPMITWEPWTSAQRPFPLRAIAAGKYDRYLRRAAGSAANWGKPFMVRFAQEMNGNWFPWGSGVGVNTARDFRKAWKHVVDLFRFHGATNVIWVWSPNEDSGGNFQFAPFYPGDRWVDWVAVDGFNFGGSEGWPSFTTIFGSTYDRLVELTDKPVMIAETGSTEETGNKAEWVASALEREAPRFPHLRAIVWFDGETSRGDFRVDSSPAALAAFRKGLGSPTYDVTRGQLLATPAALPGQAAAPEPPSGGYGAPSWVERLRHELHGIRLVIAIAVAVLILAGLVLLVSLARRRRVGRRRGTW